MQIGLTTNRPSTENDTLAHYSIDVCDFAAILNAFRDQSGTVRDEMNAHGTPNEGRARRPLPRAEFWKEHA